MSTSATDTQSVPHATPTYNIRKINASAPLLWIATQQDASLYGTLLETGDSLTYRMNTGRGSYVHVARGEVNVSGQTLIQGDGLAAEDYEALRFEGIRAGEVLLFDLP